MVVLSSQNASCKHCGERACKVVATLRNVCIVKCTKCNLTFVNKGKDIDCDKDYFSDYDLDKYVSYYQNFRENSFRKHLKAIEKYTQKGSILDVGCSFGWFLNTARDLGWQPFGIEPAKEVADIARKKYNMTILQGNIESIDAFGTNFQVVTLWNALEHMAEPQHVLRRLHDKLYPGGFLVIAVPNIEGLISRIAFLAYKLSLGKVKFPLEQLYQVDNPCMHLFHYSANTLSSMLESCNFKVTQVIKQPIIDSKNIKDRINMDKGLEAKPQFIKFCITTATRSIFYISDIANLHDTIVIYAKKEDKQ
ncbi:MAG: class I SAM-dependent methyltransferase [Candidatus Omnitrophica bacterium]|nr:class I SAM-dependent methyltransferase [Candidatus Omnitrophota bacterium]